MSPSGDAAPSLQWTNITFARKGKTILHDLTGEVRPGRLTAILGPSGAGKSSLLNLLAGRVGGSGVSGQVSLGGKTINSVAHKRQFAYVMQDDALYATFTPKEAIEFSGKLHGIPADQIRSRTADLLKMLHIEKCADTLIGNELIKGVSGGERKRAAIGVDLIHQPDVLFLDEPTSGLDSFTAYKVVELMSDIAHEGGGRTVLATIHQPSSEVFQLFDDAVFLWRGHTVYHGPVKTLNQYFTGLGKPCPENYNTADHVMFLLQTETEETLQQWVDLWRKSEQMNLMEANVDEERRKSGMVVLPPVHGAGVMTQIAALLKRDTRNIWRDVGTLIARVVLTGVLGVLYGLVFKDSGDTQLRDYLTSAHFGGITMVSIAVMFGAAQPVLLTFPSERPVFLREYAAGMYGTLAYMMSKTIMEVPVVLAQVALQMVCAYWLMGWNGSFMLLWLALVCLAMASSSMALWMSCFMKDAKQAMEAAPLLLVPQIMFAGFFISIDLIPSFLRWAQYICSLKYSLNLVLLAEFNNVDKLVINPQGVAVPANEMLWEANDITEDDLGLYVAILGAIFVGFRVWGAVALGRLSRTVF